MTTKHERAVTAIIDEGGVLPQWVRHIINTYNAVMREVGPDEVRVRMCVAISDDGQWQAHGCDDCSDGGERRAASWADKHQYRWIEATVPAWQWPTEPVVEGECDDA